MSQKIQSILILADILFTAALVFYFANRSIANMKPEYKDKWLIALNGKGSKDWYTEKGWSYVKRIGITFILGAIIFLIIIIV